MKIGTFLINLSAGDYFQFKTDRKKMKHKAPIYYMMDDFYFKSIDSINKLQNDYFDRLKVVKVKVFARVVE